MTKKYYDRDGRMVAEDNGNEAPKAICQYHTGLIEQIKSMTFFAKLSIVLFVGIGMAVVGFLWHGQSVIWAKVEINHKETVANIQEVKEKMIILDYKVQQHLTAWPTPPNGNPGPKSDQKGQKKMLEH